MSSAQIYKNAQLLRFLLNIVSPLSTKRMRIFLYLLALLWFPVLCDAQDLRSINHFIVKENLIKNGKLAIIATDADENPLDSISGTYQFVINGFEQSLKFNEGVAITPHAMEASAFVFIKHRNQQGSHGRLYYVLRNDGGLNPIAINWYYLILIPALILLIAYLFKRLMILALVILAGFFIFNYSKGLNLENWFETITHGIKAWY
ncbi:hypothetical protein ACFQRK_00685 [Parapedobacter sp. GCM10030251]|jgi:hypothetical protein